jgi:Rap1a immunity proteins
LLSPREKINIAAYSKGRKTDDVSILALLSASRGGKMRYAVAILLALTMPASAEDTDSANYFLLGCKGLLGRDLTTTSKNMLTWKNTLCLAYIQGLLYAGGGNRFCQPNGATSGQGVAIVIKYIEARPERMHEPFGGLALEALEEAWPCKR